VDSRQLAGLGDLVLTSALAGDSADLPAGGWHRRVGARRDIIFSSDALAARGHHLRGGMIRGHGDRACSSASSGANLAAFLLIVVWRPFIGTSKESCFVALFWGVWPGMSRPTASAAFTDAKGGSFAPLNRGVWFRIVRDWFDQCRPSLAAAHDRYSRNYYSAGGPFSSRTLRLLQHCAARGAGGWRCSWGFVRQLRLVVGARTDDQDREARPPITSISLWWYCITLWL